MFELSLCDLVALIAKLEQISHQKKLVLLKSLMRFSVSIWNYRKQFNVFECDSKYACIKTTSI